MRDNFRECKALNDQLVQYRLKHNNELGHQFGGFGECNNDCVMNPSVMGYWLGSAYETPKFCPAHIDSIR
jgi:predicted Zn-dependent protease